MIYKTSNQNYIKKIIKSNYEIKELSIDLKDVNQFMDDFFEFDENSDWALAVNPVLIVDNKNFTECQIRAKNIVDTMIEQDLKGLNILDFGCGDGTTAEEMKSRGANVIPYDIEESKWNIKVCTDWGKVDNAKYDLIFVYDVLDHIVNEEPNIVLKRLKNLLKDDGKIIIRFHPWISRHGGHYYNQINRAWIHLLFTEDQLKNKGYETIPTRKVIHPLHTYKKWIEDAGLKIIKEEKIMEDVEDYFVNNELFKIIINKHFKDSPFEDYKKGEGDLSRVMSFDFVDYILSI